MVHGQMVLDESVVDKGENLTVLGKTRCIERPSRVAANCGPVRGTERESGSN